MFEEFGDVEVYFQGRRFAPRVRIPLGASSEVALIASRLRSDLIPISGLWVSAIFHYANRTEAPTEHRQARNHSESRSFPGPLGLPRAERESSTPEFNSISENTGSPKIPPFFRHSPPPPGVLLRCDEDTDFQTARLRVFLSGATLSPVAPFQPRSSRRTTLDINFIRSAINSICHL